MYDWNKLSNAEQIFFKLNSNRKLKNKLKKTHSKI